MAYFSTFSTLPNRRSRRSFPSACSRKSCGGTRRGTWAGGAWWKARPRGNCCHKAPPARVVGDVMTTSLAAERYFFTRAGVARLQQRLQQARLSYKDICDDNPEARQRHELREKLRAFGRGGRISRPTPRPSGTESPSQRRGRGADPGPAEASLPGVPRRLGSTQGGPSLESRGTDGSATLEAQLCLRRP